MDIFKLLSRSTKLKTKKVQAQGQVQHGDCIKLPSAGASVNPQLFNDALPEQRGIKRKRGMKAVREQIHSVEDERPFNFFTSRDSTAKLKDELFKSTAGRSAGESEAQSLSLLNEEECRQILRSHRVKVTLLPQPVPKISKAKNSRSNSRKQDSKHGEKPKQIYPQPLTELEELRTIYGISGRMAENLARQGYKIPTEVQMGSLPLLLRPDIALTDSAKNEGNTGSLPHIDLLVVAPTGSGKTVAFLLPVVQDIMQRRRTAQGKHHRLDAVILAPTKELASQIVNEAKKLTLGTGIMVFGMRKGANIAGEPESDAMEREASSGDGESFEDGESVGNAPEQPVTKPDILISTPGLLLSALSTSSSAKRATLPTVCSLVLDEADVLVDQLFRDQTLAIWNSCTNPKLRVSLWSATMGSNIETLASSTISNRRTQLGLNKSSRIIRLVVGLKDSAIPNITHKLVYAATEPGKLLALRQMLHPTAGSASGLQYLRPPFLVFTQTIPRAIALHSELLYDIPASAGGSSRIAVLHSDLSGSARELVMTRFRNGEVWVLITTDILSRGVDFRGINGVVNYDVPNSGAAYIHRVGRTGRAGREGGVAVTLYTKEDIPYIRNIANIIAASEKQAGLPASEASTQKWLLETLPKVSKQDKKNLKMYGVEARRGGLTTNKEGRQGSGAVGKMLISSKSGYERKWENRRRGAIEGSRRRQKEGNVGPRVEEDARSAGSDNEWGGIDD